MQKYKPPLPILLAIWVTCGLGIYGMTAWYFTESGALLLVVPASIIGLVLGAVMWRSVRHLYTEKSGRWRAPLLALMVAGALSVAAGIGLPAVILRIMGPDTQISATVLQNERGSRRCRRQIYLAEYWPSRICVSAHDHEWMQQGTRVLLNARRSVFGTFVFSIEPAGESSMELSRR